MNSKFGKPVRIAKLRGSPTKSELSRETGEVFPVGIPTEKY